MIRTPTALVLIIPLKKKDEQELKDLGYEFSHNGKNHKVYKHKTIKYPYEGHQTIVSQGTYDFGSYLKMLKATVKYSLDAMA